MLKRFLICSNCNALAQSCSFWPYMNINELCLVSPERWVDSCITDSKCYEIKARTLATKAGQKVLDGLTVFDSLPKAIGQSTLSIGTTSRIGGWRQHILSPQQAAELTIKHLHTGGKVSFIFGPEDTGLENTDIELCNHLICIPTSLDAPSLNVAQAVLTVCYELHKLLPETSPSQSPLPRIGRIKYSPTIKLEQKELLITNLQQAIQAIGYLPAQNSNYFMLPLRHILNEFPIRHNEFSMLMGISKKILRMASASKQKSNNCNV